MKRLPEEIRNCAPTLRQAAPETQGEKGSYSASLQFLRQNPLQVLATSAALLIPVYWHRRIEAGDLASHVYTAWLVHLIRRGQAPDLWIARQTSNILFDMMLSGFGEIFGLRVAERISVSFAVLTFFWGAFALIAAATRRAPWFLAPLLAIFTYGWTFEMGLMNYYISLGLSFFALAAFWRPAGLGRLIPLLWVPLIWMANPLGVFWLFGSAGFILLAESGQPNHDWILLVAAGVFLTIARIFLAGKYRLGWPDKPFFFYTGADQLVLFGSRYYIPAGLLIVFSLLALAIDVRNRARFSMFWSSYRLPVELYFVAGMASVLLPSSVALPNFNVPISLLTQRLSSVLGILACCILGTMKPRGFHVAGFTLIAAIFFLLLYQDTGIVNHLEEQVERSVAALPPGRQVLSALETPPGSRIPIQHIVDRACIGHCFSFDNFEVNSGAFRVRAMPGNTNTGSSIPILAEEQSYGYPVRPQNQPVSVIYLCDATRMNVCVRDFSEGTPARQ